MNEFSKWANKQEIEMRGRVMQMSADMEFLLLKIMLLCIVKEGDKGYKRVEENDNGNQSSTDKKRP